MKITKNIQKRTLTIAIEGEIDSTTSSEFENSIKEDINKVDNLVLDFDKCSYISSAGSPALQKILLRKSLPVF